MALSRYGILKGHPIKKVEEFKDTPHYQIHVQVGGTNWRIAVNVQSSEKTEELENSFLQFFIAGDYRHPFLEMLPGLDEGFHKVPKADRKQGGLCLDFIRGNLFDRTAMQILPVNVPGPLNDLNDFVDAQVQRAIDTPGSMLYSFGSDWGPENKPDTVFEFKPNSGVHDIHMNQGNRGSHSKDNGVWQDGGMFIQLPGQNRWSAIFLKFQSQWWHTDDKTGNAIGPEPILEPPHVGDVPVPVPVNLPSPAEPDHKVRIIAALVNPLGPAPEHEQVILLNTTAEPISLSSWKIADVHDHRAPLNGTLWPNQTLVVDLPPEVQLPNSGGTITLLNGAGLKVDGVAYTKQQAREQGRTVVF